ncbi:MAG: TIGR00730 family Rossman fold protein [Acidobacteria bacterium]|nr:TIGR00730 family Rossman fold protein [Acidobacteriota bacterium]
MPPRKVTVYCAASRRVPAIYLDAAASLGAELAGRGAAIYTGGGSVGLMGRLADAALASGGEVIGIIPRFMQDLEWGHSGLTRLHVVPDMHVRKAMLLAEGEALVALPGGCGTLEELLEAITWKRLGLFVRPIVLVNINGFYNPLLVLLQQMIDQGFMDARHSRMWQVVDQPAAVWDAIRQAPAWEEANRRFAVPGVTPDGTRQA